jgi:type I restriction enzyme R subunit
MIMPVCGGKSVKVFHGDKSFFRNFRFIDFSVPENNDFAVTVNFQAAGKSTVQIDTVVFVNGIPFAIIENEAPSVPLENALNRMNRNQAADYCPRLFAYPQLLAAANKEEFKYGTTGTPNKFYAGWKEKDAECDMEKHAKQLIGKPIHADIYKKLLSDLDGTAFGHEQEMGRAITGQDRSVAALFQKDRLLDLTRNYILYDAGIKKIVRYQQYFAVKRTLKTVSDKEKGVKGKKRRKYVRQNYFESYL